MNLLRVIKLQNIMKEVDNILEDNENSMEIYSWGGPKRTQRLTIISIGYLRHYIFKQSIKR